MPNLKGVKLQENRQLMNTTLTISARIVDPPDVAYQNYSSQFTLSLCLLNVSL
jgi:hypothetical protein